MADYTPEKLHESLIAPTLHRIPDDDSAVATVDIRINNNNVSHARKLGLIRVNDLDELFETTELFSRLLPRLPGGNGVFAATLSGGLISLTADVGEKLNLRFPGWSPQGRKAVAELLPPYAGIDNPLDAWGFGRVEETYSGCLLAAAAEPEADLLLVSQDVPPDMAPRQVEQYAVVARAAVEAFSHTGKPAVFLSTAIGLS